MNSRKFALTLLLMLSLSIATTAKATTVNFCFGWDIEYNLASANGDYLIDNNVDVPAEGVHFRVDKKITDLIWQTVVSDFTDENGCKTLDLDYGDRYRVLVIAHSYVNGGNIFQAYRPSSLDPEEIGEIHAQYVSAITGFVLNTNYKYFDYDYITPWRTSNVMAASTYAFKYNRVNISNEYLTFLTKNVTGTWGGYDDSSQLIRLENEARDSKFTIVHEMGHFVHYVINQHEEFMTGCNIYDDQICPCPNGCVHRYDTNENQGCAAKEGFADFYAAAVFNDRYGAGCFYKTEDCDIYNNTMVTDCAPTPPFQDNYFDGLGVEGDWAEFYWELHSGTQKWSLLKIALIFLHVDTSDWDGGGHNNVIESMSDAVHSHWGAYSGDYFDDQSDLGEGGACDDACIGF